MDARLDAVWRTKGVRPRSAAGDDVFLRRAYLELTGAIPSVAEARDFLQSTSAESTSAGKRERLIRSLLDDKRFSEHYARLWARTLAPAGNTRGPFEAWLRGEFRKNTPFDQLATAENCLGRPLPLCLRLGIRCCPACYLRRRRAR